MLYYGMCADLGGQKLVDLVMKKVVERVPEAKAQLDEIRANFNEVSWAYGMIVGKAVWEWDREILVFFLEYLFDERKELAEEYLKEGRKHQEIYIRLLEHLSSDTEELVEVAFGRNILSEKDGWVYCEGRRLVSVDELNRYCDGNLE